MPTSWDKRKVLKARARRAAAMRGTAQTTETPAQKRAVKIAKLEAGRKAEALKRQPGATRKIQKTPVKPLTHSEKAAARQEEATRAIGFGGLFDVLTGKKKE